MQMYDKHIIYSSINRDLIISDDEYLINGHKISGY